MKLPELNEFKNSWPSSLETLKSRVLDFFNRSGITSDNVWFADIDMVLPENLQNKKNIQVILFGGFLDRLFESGNWPEKNYTFWCLTPKIKQVMTELLDFEEEAIRVIPRYELFQKQSEERSLSLEHDLKIIYSGRLSSQKNIEMLFFFAEYLKEKLNKDVSLVLLGSWDNHKPKSRGRFVFDSYEDHVRSIILKMNPTVNVIHQDDLDQHEWLGHCEGNSMLVNFSTFYCEDYGVAVAQAQELGLPMLLSKWGAHSDVTGKNIRLVDVQDIGESFTPVESISLKAQLVVNKFLQGKLETPTHDRERTVDKPEKYLSLIDLNEFRKKAMSLNGQELGLAGRNLISLYAGSVKGKEFFKKYSAIFSR